MGELGHAGSFKDLAVYQKARSVSFAVFELTRSFPREEMRSLTDQIRRSSRSVGAQIAESWGKRRYEKHFVSKLTDADSEQYETQHWLGVALDHQYITPKQADEVLEGLLSIGRMLNSMMRKAHLFCASDTDRVREELAEYIVDGEE